MQEEINMQAMQFTTPGETWTNWSGNNPHLAEADRLTALREIMFETAQKWVDSGEITAEWANKKLAKLGVTQRIAQEVPYILRVAVTAELSLTVYASTRAGALEKANERLTGNGNASVTKVAGAGVPEFVSGPEDPDVALAAAPQTVDDTLVILREVLMLGNISGPKWNCNDGTNAVLASYGLPQLPVRRMFTVDVAVEGSMKTTVQAYDEETAKRVAAWRWDDGRNSWELDDVRDTAAFTVYASPS